jgi:hypothetical protein
MANKSRHSNNNGYEDSASDSEDNKDNAEANRQNTQRITCKNESLRIATPIKEARSMGVMAKERMASAKNETKKNLPDTEMEYTLVCNYAQNMEMPDSCFMQPGKTYYFTPKTINQFGIVDCNPEKEVLYGYCYGEEGGHKGGNDVASLLMKHLEDCGLGRQLFRSEQKQHGPQACCLPC